MKNILIVSPIPSHPQQQGNSARIFNLGRMWQEAGYLVHFVYYGMEGLVPTQEADKRLCWDFFHYIEPQREAPEPSLGDHYHVDDWYDDRVSDYVNELCRHWQYDVCLVNYVWFSKVLEVLPSDTFKMIDTHDVFGDRHLVAKNAGLEPVWFYTSKALEAMALQRADKILAIQDEEKAYFETLVTIPVETIGYVTQLNFLPCAVNVKQRRARVGYIGSANPFNAHSIACFHQALLKEKALKSKYEFHLAGSVCDTLGGNEVVFEKWGRVESVSEFYAQMDIIINPMIGGTGLKIKSLEALSFGKPLIATHDAMVGIEVFDSLQQCQDINAMIESLNDVDSLMLAQLTVNSRQALRAYNKKYIAAFKHLAGN